MGEWHRNEFEENDQSYFAHAFTSKAASHCHST
jgi:hypothetical protein